MRGWFVTGTDTGVGKTVVAAAIVAALAAKGHRVAARKPLITGLDEPARPDWPHDHELLAQVSRAEPAEVVFASFGPAVSPHLALELAGAELDREALRASLVEAASGVELLVVEGVGGLLVPLNHSYDVRALARDLGLPLIIVARPGLGTLNHTLLTIEAARRSELEIAGVVLTPWPEAPSAVERSNRQTIARLGQVEVGTLPYIGAARPEVLAAAGSLLPLDRWSR